MSDLLVDIKDLNLYFQIDYHRSQTARDIFVGFFKNPLQMVVDNRDKLHVLRNINLQVKKGERVGIVGINGTGKTSLCRVISGMYHPDNGTVKTEGEVRVIMDTNVGILPELTGRENADLLVSLIYRDRSPEEKQAIIEEAIEFSDLGHFIDTPFRLYSKGMQARLCLAIISTKSSDILILDEVFDGADQFFQEKMSNRILNTIHESGCVIFVSHSQSNIRKACSRLIVMKDHQIFFDGDVEEGLKIYNDAHKS